LPKLTNKRGQQVEMKALIIILGYLIDYDELDDSVKEDLESILKLAPFHLE
jgi:hypothetical protein